MDILSRAIMSEEKISMLIFGKIRGVGNMSIICYKCKRKFTACSGFGRFACKKCRRKYKLRWNWGYWMEREIKSWLGWGNL